MDLIAELGGGRVGLLGLTVKRDTDDLRNSPYHELARRLVRQGGEVRVFDPDLDPESLIGANMEFVNGQLPGFGQFLVTSADDVMEFGEIVVLAKDAEPLVEAALGLRPDQYLLDLTGMSVRPVDGSYLGIAW
jgi:GDP-mannose 6-dehydrogenase